MVWNIEIGLYEQIGNNYKIFFSPIEKIKGHRIICVAWSQIVKEGGGNTEVKEVVKGHLAFTPIFVIVYI